MLAGLLAEDRVVGPPTGRASSSCRSTSRSASLTGEPSFFRIVSTPLIEELERQPPTRDRRAGTASARSSSRCAGSRPRLECLASRQNCRSFALEARTYVRRSMLVTCPRSSLFPRSFLVLVRERRRAHVRSSAGVDRVAAVLVATFDPALLDGAEAKELRGVRRVEAAGRGRADVGGGAGGGDGVVERTTVRSGTPRPGWLSVTGTTVGRARATIETAERLGTVCPRPRPRCGRVRSRRCRSTRSPLRRPPIRGREARRCSCAVDRGVKGLKDSARGWRRRRRRIRRSGTRRRGTTGTCGTGAISDVEGLIELRGPIDETARSYGRVAADTRRSCSSRRGSRPEDEEPRGAGVRRDGPDGRRLRDGRTEHSARRGRRRRSCCGSITRRSSGGTPRPARCARSPGSGRYRWRWCSKLAGDVIFKA